MVFKIIVEGKNSNDVSVALEEIKKLIESGCTSGTNSNDESRFFFERFESGR